MSVDVSLWTIVVYVIPGVLGVILAVILLALGIISLRAALQGQPRRRSVRVTRRREIAAAEADYGAERMARWESIYAAEDDLGIAPGGDLSGEPFNEPTRAEVTAWRIAKTQPVSPPKPPTGAPAPGARRHPRPPKGGGGSSSGAGLSKCSTCDTPLVGTVSRQRGTCGECTSQAGRVASMDTEVRDDQHRITVTTCRALPAEVATRVGLIGVEVPRWQNIVVTIERARELAAAAYIEFNPQSLRNQVQQTLNDAERILQPGQHRANDPAVVRVTPEEHAAYLTLVDRAQTIKRLIEQNTQAVGERPDSYWGHTRQVWCDIVADCVLPSGHRATPGMRWSGSPVDALGLVRAREATVAPEEIERSRALAEEADQWLTERIKWNGLNNAESEARSQVRADLRALSALDDYGTPDEPEVEAVAEWGGRIVRVLDPGEHHERVTDPDTGEHLGCVIVSPNGSRKAPEDHRCDADTPAGLVAINDALHSVARKAIAGSVHEPRPGWAICDGCGDEFPPIPHQPTRCGACGPG